MDQEYELPVDIQQRSEIVQSRIGLVVVVSVLSLLTFFIFMFSIYLGSFLAQGAESLPDIRLLEDWQPNQSTRIFDRRGNLIANIHGDEDRVVVPLSDISPHIQRAVMAIEDNRFYHHGGVDVRGTLRAAAQNASGGDVQGGSTLTQQLVKNLFLTPERSLGRKIAEAMLAMRVEKHYPKNKILEMYLNQVYWGNQAYGIEKAARRYFKKPAKDLTIAEAALLAGLLKAPEGLSPFVYKTAARNRQLEVLGKMEENGYITAKQKAEAIAEPWELASQEAKASKHPFFVTYVIQELVDKFGEDVVRRGGLKVTTTMDEEIQDGAEKALEEKVKALPEYTNVTQGAVVAIDVETAEIVAMVGGVDFQKSQFNSATQAKRAVGSTFKPFVYLTGLRLGLITPDSMISDQPVSFNTGYSVWHPKNWDGRFMGPMTIRKALSLSRNTTTVQVGMKVGIDEVIKTAQAAGIESPIDRNYSSLLGSSGVAPLELATAYSTFARGGVWMKPTAIKKVENLKGHVLQIDIPQAKRTLEPGPVLNLVSILRDVVENGTGKAARLPGRQVAGKTGTTDSVRDIWFAGFTSDMVACVWMGNDKYVPLNGVFSSDAAQVWHAFAEKYYQVRPTPSANFPDPPKLNIAKAGSDLRPAAKPLEEAGVEEGMLEEMPLEASPAPTQTAREASPPVPALPGR